MIRAGLHYRREIFQKGLEAVGYAVTYSAIKPEKDDVLVIWNRYGQTHREALRFEAVGARVLVVENGYLGKNFNGSDWYAISKNHHNGAGSFPYDKSSGCVFRVSPDLLLGNHCPTRGAGTENVLLPQRGIGESGVAMPRDFQKRYAKWLSLARPRVRPHPAKDKTGISLEDDLKNAKAVITWGSGAALKAIAMGIPCVHFMENWIGAPASTYYKDVTDWDKIPYIDPTPMLARLSWAMWDSTEIASGEAFEALLN